MSDAPQEKVASNHNDNLGPISSKMQLRTPKYGIHPHQHPTEQYNRKLPVLARSCSTPTASITSQEYSNHTRSVQSKNSRNSNEHNTNGIVVSSFSNLATQSIELGKYKQALEYYQLALQDYTKDESKTTVVELVNAAATCFNLGALAKKLRDHPQAAQYFAQAQDIYRESGMMVESYAQSIARGTTEPLSPSAASSASGSTYSCQVCLLQLIAETLQASAHLHYKYQSLVDDAVKCHEEVIELLEDSNINNSRSRSESEMLSFEHDVVYHKIHFTTLPRSRRWQLLVTSLQALGKFYVEKGELEDAIIAYRDTLSTLKKLNEFEVESTLHRQEEIMQILGALSDFFMQNYLESTDVVKLERAAFFQEGLERWEKAMQCWERVLYCQSKEYGDDSFEVSITLGQLARVMVLEGNLEGALDLYQATANISLRNARDQKSDGNDATDSATFSIPEEIISGILHVFLELDRVPHGIDWLKSLLSRSERREDQARIQLELGKLYLHLGYIHDASDSLYQSLELFDGEDESAFELLQRVEFLGERGDHERFRADAVGNRNHANAIGARSNNITDERGNGGDCLTAIIEDGESAFLTEGTSAFTSSLGAALNKLAEDDDNDSEDLSKIMVEIDDADDRDIQQSGAQFHEYPKKTAIAPDDEMQNQGEAIEDENKEVGFPGHYPLEKRLSQSYSENEMTPAKVSDAKHQPVSPRATAANVIKNETQDSEKFQQHVAGFDVRQNDSGSPLLDPAEEPATAQSLPSPPKRESSPKMGRGRKGYTEIKASGKQPGPTGTRRIVKALASPFKRSRSKSRSRSGNRLVPLDEEKEIRQSMPTKKSHQDLEDESCDSRQAPISYIDVQGFSDDERSLVSQLTFREYEMLSRKKEMQNENGHWWWGATSEGLEGWFPSDYVNQAVEAAEGFLSAKSIHDRVKSRPLDFDSDEESEVPDDNDDDDEDFSLLRDSVSQPAKPKGMANDSAKSKHSKPLDSPEQPQKQSFESPAVKEVDESKSESNKPQSLESLIEMKETELDDTRNENGPEDLTVAGLLFDLAELHLKKKDSTLAMLYCRQAMKIQKGLDPPEACKTLNFMAEIHARERRYTDALMCYSEVQRIHEALYGYVHEEIATDLNHCGNILARQGKFDLAMEKHKEALRILKDCCGENVKNPIVSETLIQIGAVYYKERNSLANIQSKQNDGYKTFIEGGMLEVIGRAHEDRGSYRMAIAFFEEKLQFLNAGESSTKESEDVAETLNSLGMLSCRAGMYLEAIDYYDRALGIQMKLGCDDVQLAMARVLAGSVQYSLGHFNKALKLFQDALGTLRQVGLEQVTVGATLFHIGAVHAALCNYDDAMSNLRDAFEIQSKLLGTEHPATFRTRREIGNLYAVYESEVDAAFDEFNDIIKAQRRLHGDKHPYVAETLHSIGCAQARNGELSGALRTFEDCYNMRLKFLGMDHPQQATTLHEIAKIQLRRGRLKKAIHIVDAALNIRVESLSEQHVDVALAMTTKASCLVARVNYADANKLFMEALPIAKAAVGDHHPSVAWIQVQIGIMHLRKCDFEEASSAVKKAIAIYKKSDLDDDHPGIKEATKELERIERAEMLCV